ncbi:MAG: hypothetical protein EHM85_13020 [Desulfobacteraceae bacterium]|nr:MAG: hypothetical protein EHM85_13020 [Desulfobacteraceae bacterium]
MTSSSNFKRLIIDAFIMAGIVTVVLNAYLLTDLFGRPIAERSEGLKRASAKWQQLTDSTVPEINNLSEKPDMDKIISHLDHSAKAEVKPQEHKIGDDMPKEPVENVLPRLTGIIKVSGSGNQPEFIALMEGKQLNKNDKIMDFTVINITSDGVSLAGKGENRFIPTPKIFFSVSK